MNAALPAGLPSVLEGVLEGKVRESGRIVHLLERFNDEVLSLLGPATDALSRSSLEQVVVLVDDPRRRELLARFDVSIQLVLVPPHRDLLMQWRALAAAFARTLDDAPVKAIHLHGFVASLICEHALRKSPRVAPILYSPHDSRTLRSMRSLARLLRLAVRPLAPRREALAIGHGEHEARALRAHPHAAVRLVEGPVAGAFFDVEAHGARHPLVVAASRAHNVRAVETFDRLAVLLGSGGLKLAFNWLGPVNEVSLARLQAANVGVYDAVHDTERASRLAAGWVFVALGGERGFPLGVAEAMAVGLPCIAIDSPAHRDLVRHGETGYLCRGPSEIIDRIAQLIDTPRLRHRMGRAARRLASERFSEASFREALLAAYQVGGAWAGATAAETTLPPALPAAIQECP